MAADRRSGDPDVAAAAYWRSVATQTEAVVRTAAAGEAVAMAEDRGAREVQATQTAAETTREHEPDAGRAATPQQTTVNRPQRRPRVRL